jgi:Transposase IS66 family
MATLRSWLMEKLAGIAAQSPLADAIRYLLRHGQGLTVFLSDGRVAVDSNAVERAIGPVPPGRNYVQLTIMPSPRLPVRVGFYFDCVTSL